MAESQQPRFEEYPDCPNCGKRCGMKTVAKPVAYVCTTYKGGCGECVWGPGAKLYHTPPTRTRHLKMHSRWLHVGRISIGVSFTSNCWALGPMASDKGACLAVGPFAFCVYRRRYAL